MVWDFIIVGGGLAGCTIAAALASSAKTPAVLLLEAGGRNDEKSTRVHGQRWATFANEVMNWGYKTTPQECCNGRQIDFARGKGLGGSSAINFSNYVVDPRDDYDQWAALVGDDSFQWSRMQPRLKRQGQVCKPESCGSWNQRASSCGYAAEWDRDLPLLMDSFKQAGLPHNPDVNSGNPVGMSLFMSSAHQGVRVTAADVLDDAPNNLTVITEAPVQRIIMEGKMAVGVEARGKQYLTTNEVILSAGTLDTPKILMHSGIGPAHELQKFQIRPTHDLPAVGQGLHDHFCAPLVLLRNPGTNDRNAFFGDQAAMDAALEQWKRDGTGPWAQHFSQAAGAFLKSDRITSLGEFKALPGPVQEFMNRETIPHYEILAPCGFHLMAPGFTTDYSYLCLPGFLMNVQSRGEVRLQSSNPDDPLLFDPKFLSHPFDRRAAVEMFRHVLEVAKHPSLAKDNISTLLGPESESDEDILEFFRNALTPGYHFTGTVKMGKPGEVDAAVDSKFRVFGVGNLRVADMSVVPLLANNHTQTTAYVTGVSCAETLIEEYGLDG